MTQEEKEQACKKCGRVFGTVRCFDVDCPNNTPKIIMNSRYKVGDIVGIYGYETDVKIRDIKQNGNEPSYLVYLADGDEWIFDDDIAYKV